MAGALMNDDGLKFLTDEPPWETACRGQLPFKREYLAGAMKWQAQAPHICPSCGPGRCDGSTQDCTLDSYYANPANGSRPAAAGGTAQNPAPAGPCPGCHTSPCKGGFSQCSAFGYGWLGPFYPATQYDDSPPTERLPAAAPKCECGSGDSARSGAHSHWCPCWVAP